MVFYEFKPQFTICYPFIAMFNSHFVWGSKPKTSENSMSSPANDLLVGTPLCVPWTHCAEGCSWASFLRSCGRVGQNGDVYQRKNRKNIETWGMNINEPSKLGNFNNIWGIFHQILRIWARKIETIPSKWGCQVSISKWLGWIHPTISSLASTLSWLSWSRMDTIVRSFVQLSLKYDVCQFGQPSLDA